MYQLININAEPEVIMGEYDTYAEARTEQRLSIGSVYINDMIITEDGIEVEAEDVQ